MRSYIAATWSLRHRSSLSEFETLAQGVSDASSLRHLGQDQMSVAKFVPPVALH